MRRAVPLLRAREELDLVVANAENAAGGSGLYAGSLRQLRAAGVDAVTLGDHVYKKLDIVRRARPSRRTRRQAGQLPGRRAGHGSRRRHRRGRHAGRRRVASWAARSCGPSIARSRPDRVLAALPADVKVIVVDVHAEATADKYLWPTI